MIDVSNKMNMAKDYIKVLESFSKKYENIDYVDHVIYESLRKNVCYLFLMLKKDTFHQNDQAMDNFIEFLLQGVKKVLNDRG